MPRTYVSKKVPTKKKLVAVAPKRSYVRKAAPMRSAPLRTVTRARAPKSSSSGGSALGTAIGSALGLALGGPGGAGVGGMIGNAGGSFLSKIFGHGDYSVSNIAAIKENNIALSNSAQPPQFGTGKVAVKIRHREFLGDVISSSSANTFKIDTYPIQPGLAVTFPWLSGVVGGSFQQYRINGMTFEFRSMSGDALNSVNTALGSVIMSTDYDSADSAFSSKQQMENTEYGVSCKPSTNMIHAIECARNQTSVSELYIRAYAPPSNADIRLYDMGKFYIATTGMQGTNVNLGELWCSYDIDVFKAIEQPPGFLFGLLHYNLLPTAAAPFTVDTSTYTQPAVNTYPGAFTATGTVLTFPLSMATNSIYMYTYMMRGTSTASLVPPTLTFAGGLSTNVTGAGFNGRLVAQNGGSGGYSAPQAVNTSTTIIVEGTFIYSGAGTVAVPPSITFGVGGTFPTGAPLGDFYVMQLPTIAA